MNTDDFETRLKTLAERTQKPAPTVQWKEQILGCACLEIEATPASRHSPPLWLVTFWIAAWVIIVGLRLSTAPDVAPAAGSSFARSTPLSPASDSEILVAFHRNYPPYLELP